MGLGVLIASAVLGATVVAGAAMGRAHVELGAPGAGLAVATARCAALAVRSELLLRGLVLRTARRANLPRWLGAVFAGLAGAAAVALEPNVAPAGLVMTAASGWLFAILWRTGGAWPAVGASAAWLVLVGAGLRGSLLDVSWQLDILAPNGRATGAPAWIASVVCVVAGLAVARRVPPADSLAC